MEEKNLPAEPIQELQETRNTAKALSKIPKTSSLVYKGETDLTITTLEKLKGHAFISKQFISDLICSPNFKKAEKDIISDLLTKYPEGAIRVQEFAKQVKEELLPLKRNPKVSTRHEGTVLSYNLRGDVTNYGEHIYASPIQTSAGDRHFSNLKGDKKDNYFAHVRTEDLKNKHARRVIEIQSDLFQKGGMEREFQSIKQQLAVDKGWEINIGEKKYTIIEIYKREYQPAGAFAKVSDGKEETYLNLYDEQVLNVLAEKRTKELSQLQTYRNTWHERIIQGEIRQAAKDKKTVLQFPTGETAMQIENIRREHVFYDITSGTILSNENIQIGKEISKMDDSRSERWMILSVLEKGCFKAIKKSNVEHAVDVYMSKGEKISHTEALQKAGEEEYFVETFDASKTNADNPIYRFYEKDVQKYLSKFGGKKIIDEKGVSWIEIPVSLEQAKMPIMALGSTLPELVLPNQQKQIEGNLHKTTERGRELTNIRKKVKEKNITRNK